MFGYRFPHDYISALTGSDLTGREFSTEDEEEMELVEVKMEVEEAVD